MRTCTSRLLVLVISVMRWAVGLNFKSINVAVYEVVNVCGIYRVFTDSRIQPFFQYQFSLMISVPIANEFRECPY